MSDVGKFIGGFGESFVKTLQTERERAEQQRQFNQKMLFENRQMNLLNMIKQKQFEADQNYRQATIQNQFGDDYTPYQESMGEIPTQTGGDLNKLYGGLLSLPTDQRFARRQDLPTEKASTSPYSNEYTADVDGKPIRMGFNKNTQQWEEIGQAYYKPNVTNINMGKTAEPYVATKDLDAAWNEYKRFDEIDKNWKNLSEKPKDNDGKEISYETFKKIKQAKLKEIEIETKDRAKKLSEEYSGFNQMFNDFLRDPDYKNAPDKDAYVSREMFGYPSEAIRQMKDLLSKRIF